MGLSIRNILEQIERGQIRVPAFQRGFVWEPDQVAYLIDSIYKGYPFGSLLLWRTKERMKSERGLGPFELPPPQAGYPVDYVLDGQQRITSIFGVFHTKPTLDRDGQWADVYFDCEARANAQDLQFVSLAKSDYERIAANPEVALRYFPLRALFDVLEYRRATERYTYPAIRLLDEMQQTFKEAIIPVQISETNDRTTIGVIFERVNRQGVELDTFQLLSAWSWSEEFQLQDQISELSHDLAPFGFAEVGSDTNLLLRCCSAILAGDASPQALLSLNGAALRERFGEVTNGIKHAIEYVRRNYCVKTLHNLPSSNLLVPLSAFFEGNEEGIYSTLQRRVIDRWFWRSAFTRRYSAGSLNKSMTRDIEEMRKLRADATSTGLAEIPASISSKFFLQNNFQLGTAITKAFLLLLAQQTPVSFVSGQPIDLDQTLRQGNHTEFHHLMPKAYLRDASSVISSENILANICFLSRADNRFLGGDAPSIYRKKMEGDIEETLERALCPPCLFGDNYEVFLLERAALLAAKARELCGLPEYQENEGDGERGWSGAVNV